MPGIHARIIAGHDCIAEFEAAAAHRYREASILLHNRHAYAAVYLYGYAIEMWIKAAYFRNEGVKAPTTPITTGDLHNAWTLHVPAGITTGKNLHDFAGWARLLTYVRSMSASLRPYTPQLELEIKGAADAARQHWDPTMRYRHLRLLPWEANKVFAAATWFKDRYNAL